MARIARYHVNTYVDSILVDQSAYPTADDARAEIARREASNARTRARFAAIDAEMLRAMITDDADSSDVISTPIVPMDYQYQVRPCTNGRYCIACLEAGLRTPPRNLVW